MRDPVLAAWQAAGTDLTMLPSGMEVRLEEIPMAEMIRSGFLPGQLLQLATRFASSEGVEPSKLEAEERANWDDLERQMICRWLVAVRWTCECGGCTKRRAVAGIDPIPETPKLLTPDQLAADPPPMPRVDLVALRDIVIYARTAVMVDAMSRVAHEQLGADEAARILEQERLNTLEGWSTFRGERPGVPDGAHREGLGEVAERLSRAAPPRDHQVPDRRGARRPTHQRKRPAQRHKG